MAYMYSSSDLRLDPVKSISYSQPEIIQSICSLHLAGNMFELDPCFNIGSMYGALSTPGLKFDLNPIHAGVSQANYLHLPLSTGSVNSCIIDPPFLVGSCGLMASRYHAFRSLRDLQFEYSKLLSELRRVLATDGILCFKCQDVIHDRRKYFTSLFILNSAIELGFNPIDEFIFIAKSRLISPSHTHRTASRSFHSKFLVFRKRSGRRIYSRFNTLSRD